MFGNIDYIYSFREVDGLGIEPGVENIVYHPWAPQWPCWAAKVQLPENPSIEVVTSGLSFHEFVQGCSRLFHCCGTRSWVPLLRHEKLDNVCRTRTA